MIQREEGFEAIIISGDEKSDTKKISVSVASCFSEKEVFQNKK
jgi:hypothetical protein